MPEVGSLGDVTGVWQFQRGGPIHTQGGFASSAPLACAHAVAVAKHRG